MDRGLYVAMTAGKNIMQAQAVRANNLANASTNGFQADFEQARAMPVYYGDGHNSRVYSMTERPGTNFQRGALNATGRDLDVAVKGDGWMAVQDSTGQEAYTRMGSLQVSPDGFLVTANGLKVMGDGGPIAVPEAARITIGKDGSINVASLGDAGNQLSVVERIKLVSTDNKDLYKGTDGLIRHKEGAPLETDPTLSIESGFLEASNVSAVDQLVNIINLSRQYEMNINMMKNMDENEETASSILRNA